MPQVIVTEGTAEGLERCRRFLATKAPEAARRAGQAIEQFLLLETAPDIGRPSPEAPELRELVIAFGDSGYVALYRHEPADDSVYVLPSGIRRKRATNLIDHATLLAAVAPVAFDRRSASLRALLAPSARSWSSEERCGNIADAVDGLPEKE
ncbi:plasmid stabilization system protein ParE [Sinorhizobium terangae]|nr:plasmid stabilization system protein ParE [Sinorhizobium terangae]